MSLEDKMMDLTYNQAFEEACWSTMIIWERINHGYTSDSPPKECGLQKGDYGYQCWSFNSHESYTVVWDTDRSYWKVETPFGIILYFIGPLFIDKSNKGLSVPPKFTVINSETEVLKPAQEIKVLEQMRKIVSYVQRAA